MRFQFIHAADIHLDSPLRGLEAYDGAPVEEIRGATRRAFENLVQTAIDREVAFVVIAGDLYDGEWRDANTGLHMVDQFARLRRSGIGVYLIHGNHDAHNRMTRKLPMPENVHVFGHGEPETLTHPALPVVFHGQSYAQRDVTENLAANYPEAVPGKFNIGLLHTALAGREGHAPYAPCSVDDLLTKRYDYWALGHVHVREVVHEDPWILFSGNLQGRHIRETGAKGATLVTVVDGTVEAVEPLELDVFRWAQVTVLLNEVQNRPEAVVHIADTVSEEASQHGSRPLAVRVELTGVSVAHEELRRHESELLDDVRASLLDVGSTAVWLQQLSLKTRSAKNLESLKHNPALGELLDNLRSPENRTRLQEALHQELTLLLAKLPTEVRDALSLGHAGSEEEQDWESLLLPLLLEAEGRP